MGEEFIRTAHTDISDAGRSSSFHVRRTSSTKPQKVDGADRRGKMIKKGKHPAFGLRPPRNNNPHVSRSTHARPRETHTPPRHYPRSGSFRSLNSGVNLCNRSLHTIHTSSP